MSDERINGLDVSELKKAVGQMRLDKRLAKLELRAHNEWVGGAHGRTRIDDFSLGGEESRHEQSFVLDADEPAELLGSDMGANATEAALHALASCLNATFIYWAALQGVKVHSLRIELRDVLDLRGFLGVAEDVRNGFEHIEATFDVKADASRGQIEELVRLAQAHSPVYDMTTNGVPVRVSLAGGAQEQAA